MPAEFDCEPASSAGAAGYGIARHNPLESGERAALFFSDDPVGRILEIDEEDRKITLSDNAEDGYSSTFRRSDPNDR